MKNKGLERFKTAQAIKVEFNTRKENDSQLNELNTHIQDLESQIEIEKRYKQISKFIYTLEYVCLNLTANIEVLKEYCDGLDRSLEDEIFKMDDIPGSAFTFL